MSSKYKYRSLNETDYKGEHANRRSYPVYVNNADSKIRLTKCSNELIRYIFCNLKTARGDMSSGSYCSKKMMIDYIFRSVIKLNLILDLLIDQAEKDYNGIL